MVQDRENSFRLRRLHLMYVGTPLQGVDCDLLQAMLLTTQCLFLLLVVAIHFVATLVSYMLGVGGFAACSFSAFNRAL